MMVCDNLDHQSMLVYFPKLLFLCTRFFCHLGHSKQGSISLVDLK